MSSESCDLCPRRCAVDRSQGDAGWCGCPPQPVVAYTGLHFWEEPCVSGSRGSGTVFFGGCNLRCSFCQNHAISRRPTGHPYPEADLARLFLEQQSQGAHNINLVSPTPYSRPIAVALSRARDEGLRLPVVYNCNGYETVEGLARLEGLVDVYLPDLKYRDDALALSYSQAPNYFAAASAALDEMARQVGRTAEFDQDGLMTRGLLVRHLVLPGAGADSAAVLRWLSRELPGVHLSLMAQYTPIDQAVDHPTLGRRLTAAEYEPLLDLCDELGLEHGYRQELDSAGEEYIPPFTLP